MRRLLVSIPFIPLVLVAGNSKGPDKRAAYVYTYVDRNGGIVVNNLPPACMQGQGLVLKHVGVGHVKLAVSKKEMARVLRSPELIALVDEISADVGVDPHLSRAIIQAESAFNYKARSRAGALGLMQLMPKTAERFGVTDPFDPKQNITGGTRYLKWLLDYYRGDRVKVIAAYNAGEGAVNRYNGIPPYKETRAYVPKVIKLWDNRSVQPDPKAAGSMDLLKKGRGGFRVDEDGKSQPDGQLVAQNKPTPIYHWVDQNGRVQISDQLPPKGTKGVKVYGTSED